MWESRGEAVGSLSDEALAQRLGRGDRSAFDPLYARYLPRVRRFVDRRLRNPADREETVQEVFFGLFASVHGFRGEAPFAAWLFGLARRTIAARFRRKRIETVPLHLEGPEPPQPTPAAQGDDPLEAYVGHERLAKLCSALEHELTPVQRQLFELHHLEDRPIHEIARALCRSEDSVKSHLYRARRVLRAHASAAS